MAAPPTLTVDPSSYSVVLATLPWADLPAALFALLELTLFSPCEPRFLSLSIVEGNSITVVTEPSALGGLRATVPKKLVQDETEWAVVRVGEGSTGFESVGVIERLTEPLAKCGIPVLYQSTYSTDYCLIPRDRLDEALIALGSVDPATPTSPSASQKASDASRHSYPLTVLDGSTSILRMEKQHRQRHTGALLRLLFMPQPGDPVQAIANLTETADEISLIAGCSEWWSAYCRDAEGLQDDPQEWVPIRVGDADGTPLDETGVIATQSKVLADANLSILYLSTFVSDYTLVQSVDLERATKAFQEAGFDVTTLNS